MFTALDKSFHQKGENFTGRVVYFEIHAEVPDRAIWFYSELLDWKFTKIHEPPMAYWMVTTGPDSKPGINGGMHQRMAPITGLGVCSFVGTTCVADLDPVVEKAVALGGQIALPKMPIPGIGWLAYIRMVGLHQGHRKQHHGPDPTGCSCQMKPTEFSWHPLTLDRWNDLQMLFGPNGACGGCWCMYWRMARKDFVAGKGAVNQARLLGVLQTNSPGVILYHGLDPVGWCAVAPRADYPVLARSRVMAPVDDKAVWSVSCFFVRKEWQKKALGSVFEGPQWNLPKDQEGLSSKAIPPIQKNRRRPRLSGPDWHPCSKRPDLRRSPAVPRPGPYSEKILPIKKNVAR